MESKKKKVPINVYAKQKLTHRYREQTCTKGKK